MFTHALFDFCRCLFAGITILFLKHTGEHIIFTAGSLQVIISEFAPPPFCLTSDLLPLTFKHVLIHASSNLRYGHYFGRSARIPSTNEAGLRETLAATARRRSDTRSGVSPLLMKASAPDERAACSRASNWLMSTITNAAGQA